MFDFRMGLKVSHGGDDLGDAGLVVGSEKSGAVGDDQVIAEIIHELGKLLRTQQDVFSFVEHYGLAVIILDNAWLYMTSRHVGTCIHVRYKAYDGYIFVGIGR